MICHVFRLEKSLAIVICGLCGLKLVDHETAEEPVTGLKYAFWVPN